MLVISLSFYSDIDIRTFACLLTWIYYCLLYLVKLLVALSISQDDRFNIRLWDVQTGFLLWEQMIKNPVSGSTNNFSSSDDDAPGSDIIFEKDGSSVVMLIEGSIIINLNITDGNLIWKSDILDRFFIYI